MDQAVVDRATAAGHGWGLADRLKANWARLGKTDSKKELPAS
jgi:hypothetical protein